MHRSSLRRCHRETVCTTPRVCVRTSVVPPGLESLGPTFPGAEAPGYWQMPLRGWGFGQVVPPDCPKTSCDAHTLSPCLDLNFFRDHTSLKRPMGEDQRCGPIHLRYPPLAESQIVTQVLQVPPRLHYVRNLPYRHRSHYPPSPFLPSRP